jgi:hypothetical protein
MRDAAGPPAASHADDHALPKVVIGFEYFSPPRFFATMRTKTCGSIFPAFFSRR